MMRPEQTDGPTSADRKYRRWQCPLCDHYLEYAPGDQEVATLAIESHLSRTHSADYPRFGSR